ncbi:T6SS phospholipase effector Tle1-like catalytic domain-containing protein [Billgrantia sp. C5P2]|uniref:T6SS phospholipase effector Tle1-like catalytic domain-containing protein n=1 Tax=Billgrantia sp. C5P2 TaxID=3436239 RepID=UPI003DA61293
MFWKLIRRFDVRDVDLPFIESPSLASSKVKEKLSRESSREELSQLYAKAGGIGWAPDKEVAIRTIVKAVELGGLLLVLNDGFDRPFLPLVKWNGEQWRSNARGVFGGSSLVDSLLPRLNARGLGPQAMATLQRHGDWGVTRPAPTSEPRPSTPPPVPETPPARPRTLQIGIFFDGTGNNMYNDRHLPDRDITNVAKLYDLYRFDGVDGDYHRVYIPGVGTITGREGEDGFVAPEDAIGMGTGVGPEGGHARIEQALNEVREILEANPRDSLVTFDVFGFSRGAALARHFVNLIHRWPETLMVPDFRLGGAETVTVPDFRIGEYRPPLRLIQAFPPSPIPFPQVRFVGLFDTVGSFYWPGNAENLDFDLYIASGSAARVVQLTAHHEIRRNFPLNSIADAQGNHPGNFAEIALPGVHSDVGGGYENPRHEADFANLEELIVRHRGGVGANGETIRRAQAEAEARGLSIRVEGMDVLEVERRATRKELAIYALHQMHDEAKRAWVPLRDLDDTDPDHVIPAELQALIDSWWQNGRRHGRQWMLEMSHEHFTGYIHTSHRQYPFTLRDRFAHAPEPSGKRRVFPNHHSAPVAAPQEPQDA